jgi:hypothetical protein
LEKKEIVGGAWTGRVGARRPVLGRFLGRVGGGGVCGWWFAR